MNFKGARAQPRRRGGGAAGAGSGLGPRGPPERGSRDSERQRPGRGGTCTVTVSLLWKRGWGARWERAVPRLRDSCATLVWGRAEWTVKYRGGDSWISGSLCSIRAFCALSAPAGCYRH